TAQPAKVMACLSGRWPIIVPLPRTRSSRTRGPRRRAVGYGAFVLSLDFELMGGVRDKRTIADYGANIRGVRQAVPALLDLFAERGIACTWVTVGLLFFGTSKAMLAALPARQPHYADARIS